MKVRHVNLHADEFLAAIAGEMSPTELGVYWMINLLIYSHGGAIEYDLDWIRAKFKPSKGNRWIAPILKGLIKSGRLTLDGNLLGSRRALDELLLSTRRIVDAHLNGTRGGRPRKDINGVDKATPLFPEKLTTNHEPLTTNHEKHAREARFNARPARFSFPEFWKVYPHKVGKGAAEKAFATASRSASMSELLDGLQRYIASKPADRPWCNPSTWLNQRRWQDEPANEGATPNAHARPDAPPPSVEEFRALYAALDALPGHQDDQ